MTAEVPSAGNEEAELRQVDVLVVGGGINGTGIARDAAGRGLSVTLCEKDDLAQAIVPEERHCRIETRSDRALGVAPWNDEGDASGLRLHASSSGAVRAGSSFEARSPEASSRAS